MRKKDIAIVAGAVVAALLLAFSQLGKTAVPTGAWGLHFSGQGQCPTGPAGSQTLKQYDAVYVGDSSQPVLYLTFDAGYENGYTSQILDTLKKQQIPAAFFLVGNYLEKNADLVRRMVDEGHIVGNHTTHHPDMSQIQTLESFQKELAGVETLFTQITGKELPKYYRPPQGVYSEENLKMAQQLGYRTVFWSLAYVDWNNDSQPTADYAFEKLIPRTHNGAVVLLHATSKTNGAILDELITRWKEMGYTFGSIDTLFA